MHDPGRGTRRRRRASSQQGLTGAGEAVGEGDCVVADAAEIRRNKL